LTERFLCANILITERGGIDYDIDLFNGYTRTGFALHNSKEMNHCAELT